MDDDIIRMADESGITFVTGHGVASATFEWLRGFAERIAAREREECAKVCDDWHNGRDDVCLLAKAIRARREK